MTTINGLPYYEVDFTADGNPEHHDRRGGAARGGQPPAASPTCSCCPTAGTTAWTRPATSTRGCSALLADQLGDAPNH